MSPCKKIHVRQVHVELSAVLAHLGPWWPVSQRHHRASWLELGFLLSTCWAQTLMSVSLLSSLLLSHTPEAAE